MSAMVKNQSSIVIQPLHKAFLAVFDLIVEAAVC
ncbi:MAG: hypothetical protein ACI9EW_004060 [Cellvibrionaceae bacterium]|jgi:hypothetical protein